MKSSLSLILLVLIVSTNFCFSQNFKRGIVTNNEKLIDEKIKNDGSKLSKRISSTNHRTFDCILPLERENPLR